MSIEFDLFPSDRKDWCFMSVFQNERESIAIDCTTREPRVIKQVFIRKEEKCPKCPSKRFENVEAVVFDDGVVLEQYPIFLVDLGDRIWCNGEIWENRYPLPLTFEQTKQFKTNCKYIANNIENLNSDQQRYQECISYLNSIVNQYKRYLTTVKASDDIQQSSQRSSQTS